MGLQHRHFSALFVTCSIIFGMALVYTTSLDQRLFSCITLVGIVYGSYLPKNTRSMSVICFARGFLGVVVGYGAASTVNNIFLFSAASTKDKLEFVRIFPIPLYFMLMAMFHMAEFHYALRFHEEDIHSETFMITSIPSGGNIVAMTGALVEFWGRQTYFHDFHLFPGNMQFIELSLIATGFGIALFAWAIRYIAFQTVLTKYTDEDAMLRPREMLVTHGIYSFCRFPGYLGWFLFFCFTQIVLLNVICFVIFGFLLWQLFPIRINEDEYRLSDMFGEEFSMYASKVPCGFPFVTAV